MFDPILDPGDPSHLTPVDAPTTDWSDHLTDPVPVDDPVLTPTVDPTTDPVTLPPGASPGDAIAGDPVGDGSYWFEQAANGYCVPASLTEVISERTGVTLTDESLVTERAASLGLPSTWMDMDQAHAVLESFGIHSEVRPGTVADLTTYLEEGRSIILAVDADEIWSGDDDLPGQADQPDHALLITGIDLTNGTAYLSDPGTPNGNQEAIPLTQLEDAWADGGNLMLVTDPEGAPPAAMPAPTDAGTIPATGWTIMPSNGEVVLPLVVGGGTA